MASYEQWLDVFQKAYSAPDQVLDLVCPNCGAKDLRLRFVILGGDGARSDAVFWCGSCLEGMLPGPSEVPATCTPVRREDANVPNYRFEPPMGRRGGASLR